MLKISHHQRNEKTSMRYHLTPVRIATINKSTNNKCWQRCGGKGTLVYCWWECSVGNNIDFKKFKMELLFDTEILLLDIYPKGPETPIQKKYTYPCVYSSAIYDCQDSETAYMPISR